VTAAQHDRSDSSRAVARSGRKGVQVVTTALPTLAEDDRECWTILCDRSVALPVDDCAALRCCALRCCALLCCALLCCALLCCALLCCALLCCALLCAALLCCALLCCALVGGAAC
jgi:hypothetical protein